MARLILLACLAALVALIAARSQPVGGYSGGASCNKRLRMAGCFLKKNRNTRVCRKLNKQCGDKQKISTTTSTSTTTTTTYAPTTTDYTTTTEYTTTPDYTSTTSGYTSTTSGYTSSTTSSAPVTGGPYGNNKKKNNKKGGHKKVIDPVPVCQGLQKLFGKCGGHNGGGNNLVGSLIGNGGTSGLVHSVFNKQGGGFSGW